LLKREMKSFCSISI